MSLRYAIYIFGAALCIESAIVGYFISDWLLFTVALTSLVGFGLLRLTELEDA